MFSCEIKYSQSSSKIFEYIWKISSFNKIAGLQLYQKLSPFLGFLSRCSEGRSRNPIRYKMELCGGSSPVEVFKYFCKGFHIFNQQGSWIHLCYLVVFESSNWSCSCENFVLKLCKYPRKTYLWLAFQYGFIGTPLNKCFFHFEKETTSLMF